jgi:predicted metalloprotease with PDZ domain
LPAGWKTAGTKPEFVFDDRRSGVFLIGRSIKYRTISTAIGSVAVAQAGDWKFTSDELDAFIVEILREYQKVFGGPPRGDVSVNLLNFPVPVAAGAWEADTRGPTVNIVSSDMPFRTQSLQRLHEQLRHELFHLWLPNSVNLTGNYDWFYEGAALYWSLRTAVGLNRIRFEDMLNTLARAHTIDSIRADSRSLLDLSGTRVIGEDTAVYSRGMLAAFLTDLHLIESSGGKRDLESLLRKVHVEHSGTSKPQNGSSVVLGLIGHPKLTRIITNSGPIDLAEPLKSAGIEASAENNVTVLRVVKEPSRSQRRTLDKLGYNNWLKLSQRSK